MFKNDLAMAVKVNDKVLREFDSNVYIPFGSEYTLFFKNTSNRRVRLEVTIDGQDVLDGHALIIEKHSTSEIKRFIKNGNMTSGNSFKFIEKTAKIEQHRGNKIEDGLITVTYEFEKEWNYRRVNNLSDNGYYMKGLLGGHANTQIGGSYETYADSVHDGAASMDATFTMQSNAYRSAVPKNDAGITAPGSINTQTFNTTHWSAGDGSKHSMTLQLKGSVEEKPVVQEIIVKKLVKCSICGTSVRQTAKFCHECGASVEIV